MHFIRTVAVGLHARYTHMYIGTVTHFIRTVPTKCPVPKAQEGTRQVYIVRWVNLTKKRECYFYVNRVD
ncbi:hypothetical protein DFP96_11326 [Listeria rocourtiae]|uniref:Uncharacterized protein n=1 Tax=Listeria rocourtiae TaxID=647910 RepID=A0A4R6ZGS3_9LIST|nr:hypothetical protein DFP96_11326 [Listeria rocourtiae]